MTKDNSQVVFGLDYFHCLFQIVLLFKLAERFSTPSWYFKTQIMSIYLNVAQTDLINIGKLAEQQRNKQTIETKNKSFKTNF